MKILFGWEFPKFNLNPKVKSKNMSSTLFPCFTNILKIKKIVEKLNIYFLFYFEEG